MRIALAGPLHLEPLKEWLHPDATRALPASLQLAGSPVTQLALGLLHQGHMVVVVTLDGAVTRRIHVTGKSLSVHVGPYRRHGRARDAFRVERRAVQASLETETRVDLVHAHWQYEYALGALATHHPTLVTVRDWAPTIWRLQRPKHYLTVRLGMATYALAKGRFFTVASPYMHDRVQRWTREEVPIIPNPLPDTAFKSRTNPLNQRAPVLLAVNQGFSRRKNITTLLKSFEALRRKRPRARLQLVGARYGPDEAAADWARIRGLSDHVEFLGQQPHNRVRRLMRDADLLVHPSLEESFGMVVVEAMSQGLPVIAGRDSGAIPWLLDYGRAGILIDVTSPTQLAQGIGELIDDANTWQHYSVSGYEHARRYFSMQRVIAQYEEMYDVVARSGSKGAARRPKRRSASI